jgi:hypothetical protein
VRGSGALSGRFPAGRIAPPSCAPRTPMGSSPRSRDRGRRQGGRRRPRASQCSSIASKAPRAFPPPPVRGVPPPPGTDEIGCDARLGTDTPPDRSFQLGAPVQGSSLRQQRKNSIVLMACRTLPDFVGVSGGQRLLASRQELPDSGRAITPPRCAGPECPILLGRNGERMFQRSGRAAQRRGTGSV